VSEKREQLADVLVEITTALVSDSDSAELLRLVIESCAALLGAAATGLVVASPRGGLEVIAASDDATRFLELLQAQAEQGPCVECIRVGAIITVSDLATDDPARWPQFAVAAREAGFVAVHAVPLRLDSMVFGGLNLFHRTATTLTRWQAQAAQALTDLAVLGLTTERDGRRGARLAETSARVLNDRIHLAQAVGMIAGANGIGPDAARTLLRLYAAGHRLPPGEVAHAITSGVLAPHELTATEV
jgi:GAF domain-containing protein